MKKFFTLLCFYQTALLAQFPETLELSNLNGQDGFVFNGANDFDFTSYAVNSAGDVNGDSLTDLLIGAWGADPSGQASLVFGQETEFSPSYQVSDLNSDFGFIINNPVNGGLIGWSVNGLGDVNGLKIYSVGLKIHFNQWQINLGSTTAGIGIENNQ